MRKFREVNAGYSFYLFVFSLALYVCISFYSPVPAEGAPAGAPSQVTLDALRVSYNDEAGEAVAEGDAVLTYEGATIRADRIDYNASSQKVSASHNPGKSVSLEALGRTVTGDSLEYDLGTKEGVFNGVRSDIPVGNGTLYISGGGMQYMPYDLAISRGLVGGQPGRKDNPAYAGAVENVSATTCALDHPHYRIEAKSMVFIPGRRLVAKRPRLYLGDTFIFTYPMDYIVNIDRKALKHSFIPYIQSSEQKGTGAGLSGALGWDTGALSLGVAYGSKIGFEWEAGIEQDIGGGFSVEGGVEYTWDEAWDEKQYRPHAGLVYERGGWKAAIRATWNEYLEERKDAYHIYRGQLDRKPEFTVLTPWIKDHALNLSWLRAGVAVGSYWERTPLVANDTVTRYGATLQSYLEYPLGRAVTFFSNSAYSAWFYDKDGADQEIAYGIVGLRYNLGALELASGYEHRKVWGESPMLWDSYQDAERFHQKIRFPFGKEFFLSVRGSYDLDASMVDDVYYSLQWVTDCMKWELRYRDDRVGRESGINLNVSILAYPNTPASFGEYITADPFEPPEDLPEP